MKAILTYKENYQINYIYQNEFEAESYTTYLLPFKKRKIIKASYKEIPTKRTNKETISIIEKTIIPENILIPFISMLISINKSTFIINQKEYTSFNINQIQNEINNINITQPKIKILKLKQ